MLSFFVCALDKVSFIKLKKAKIRKIFILKEKKGKILNWKILSILILRAYKILLQTTNAIYFCFFNSFYISHICSKLLYVRKICE